MARTIAKTAVLPRALARPSTARPLLAAWLGLRGFFGDPMSGLRRRRLGGRLYQRDPASPRRIERAAPWAHRPLGSPLSARRRAGPGDRIPARGLALVGPLAEGRGSRHHGRADAPRLPRRMVAARRPRSGARPLRRRGAMAVAADRTAFALSKQRRPWPGASRERRRDDPFALLDWCCGGRMDGHRGRWPGARRSASRRRLLPRLRRRTIGRAPGDSRRAGGRIRNRV